MLPADRGEVKAIERSPSSRHDSGDCDTLYITIDQEEDPDAMTEEERSETGEGDTLDLTADTERQLHPGDELAIRLPSGEDMRWTYEIDGDHRAIDLFERAAVVSGGHTTAAPGASGAVQFLLRAERKGKATVRFERLDRTAGDRPLRLKIKVK